MSKVKKYSLGLAIFLTSFTLSRHFLGNTNPTDITKNSVMVINKAMNHGGTGVIYQSGQSGSYVLTNKHVCDVLKTAGGVVKTTTGVYQVQAMLESKVSDLCLTFTPANLNQNTLLASEAPKTFSPVKVSGHPALLPTIITTGHFSERQIIQVFIGMQPCTADDASNPDTSLLCAFFGGLPMIKSYESVLVSATIMPGSSGSGVYNANDELSGLVFAGSRDFAYGWTVPYDQVAAFLRSETQTAQWETLDQTISLFNKKDEAKGIKEVLKKCASATEEKVLQACQVIKNDMTWVK